MGIERMNDATAVAEQYAGTANLETRRAVWGPTAEGRSPHAEALAAVVGENPSTFLDVGCGTGAFARQVVDALPGCRVQALDLSDAMVAQARAAGVDAQVGDAQQMPFPADSFDVVASLWMLYHVPDVDRAVAELRRVLRPGGLAVVATNSEDHLRDLKEAYGLRPTLLPFSAENGPGLLQRHFGEVTVDVLRTRATFDNAGQLRAYLDSMQMDASLVADFDEPKVFHGAPAVMLCR